MPTALTLLDGTSPCSVGFSVSGVSQARPLAISAAGRPPASLGGKVWSAPGFFFPSSSTPELQYCASQVYLDIVFHVVLLVIYQNVSCRRFTTSASEYQHTSTTDFEGEKICRSFMISCMPLRQASSPQPVFHTAVTELAFSCQRPEASTCAPGPSFSVEASLQEGDHDPCRRPLKWFDGFTIIFRP